MSFRYSNKNDFDDMNVIHQTKSQFKNLKPNLQNIQNSRRSSFIDCFTGDSIVSPATICPPGVNSTRTYPCVTTSDNKSSFSSYHCPPGMNYNEKKNRCDDFSNRMNILNPNKRSMITNRKKSYFYSIVE